MRSAKKIRYLAIASSALSIMIIIVTIGIFIFYISYDSFYKDAEEIRNEYYRDQREFLKNRIYDIYDYITYYKSSTEERMKEDIKNRVNEAYELSLSIYKKNKDKSTSEIENMIVDIFSSLNVNNNGYYFIINKGGREILLPKKSGSGTADILNFQDSNGKYIFSEMLNIAETKKEGYYEYEWTKPNESGYNYNKISYIKYFEPLDLIIGTGLYFDDVEALVKKDLLERISEITYENDGYVFVTTFEGEALVFSNEDYIGQNISQIEDINGVNIHNEELKVLEENNGEGFVHYFWAKPSNTRRVYPKMTYVKSVKDWEWILGTGVYVDEIEETIEFKKQELKKHIYTNISNIIIIISFIGAVILFIELCILKRMETTIKEEEKKYETLTNLSEDGIFILEPNGDIIETNNKGMELLYCSKDKLKQLNFNSFINETIDNYKDKSFETSIITTENQTIQVEIYSKSIKIGKHTKYIIYIRDLTARKIYEETLKSLAITDELTQIYNRRFIIDQLNIELKDIQNSDDYFSIAMLDIDRFKKINDTFGHTFGDKVLQKFSETLKGNFRSEDFIGRYGGEEFLIIMPNMNKDESYELINKIKDLINAIDWEEEDLKTSFSGGVLEINEENNHYDVKYYLKTVDQLLYKAKENGRNRIELD